MPPESCHQPEITADLPQTPYLYKWLPFFFFLLAMISFSKEYMTLSTPA